MGTHWLATPFLSKNTKTLITKNNFKFAYFASCYCMLQKDSIFGHVNEHVHFCYLQNLYSGSHFYKSNMINR